MENIKKVMKIIGLSTLTLWSGYQQFCYANPVGPTPTQLLTPFAFLIGFIAVVVLVASAISFLILKKTREENMTDDKIQKISVTKKRIFICIGIIIVAAILPLLEILLLLFF